MREVISTSPYRRSLLYPLETVRTIDHTDSAKFLHSRNYTACASISRNPYFFLLASARIESETTRFNRNPYQFPPTSKIA
ncbi:hypothetical protein DVJ83_06640 [Deinococcus wulumuqiensis]|uniref:Uncharacterized protein n=1 Tax=Deinococcus wulumuqiensis TaxID=980427 RepID=A0A345IGS2_9DEIO|nr:hypothetical protein DVJ83_06640 [Deinococcus wulumuqiensis]